MVTQSHAKAIPLLLTRPTAQGADFAADLTRRFGDSIHVIKTPLLAPRFYAPVLPDGPFSALILSSQTGAVAYAKLGKKTQALPRDVFCVGQQTARHARAHGLHPVLTAPDAATLIAQITAHAPQGRLLHLRGRDARGDVKKRLIFAGIDTEEAVIYAQLQQPLGSEATAVLLAKDPVIVPLFSPRTAEIFTGEVVRVAAVSPLFLAVLSGAVALEATTLDAQIKIATSPDAQAMLETVALLLDDVKRA